MAYNREMRIAIMGATGSGKTTFINCASASDFTIGKGLESCTSEIQTSKPFRLNGRIVTLIDTPGFDDTSRKDTDILKLIAAYLQNTYEQGTKLAGVIYMHRISDFRMGGTSKRNFTMFRELCGESSLKSVLLVSNMWSEVKLELGEAREAELAGKDKFFKPVLEKGARMLRHDGTKEGAHRILRHLINQQPATLQIQDELVNKHLDIAHTGAGAELTRALQFQADRHSEELMNLRAEMEKALKAKDEETREELREEVEQKHQEIMRIRRDAEQMAAEYAEEKAKLDAKIFEMEDAHRKQVEALEALNEHVSTVQKQMEETKEEHARREQELLAAKRIEEEQRIRALEEEKRIKARDEEESRKRLQILQEEVEKARREMQRVEKAKTEQIRREREKAERDAAEKEREIKVIEDRRLAAAHEEEEHRKRLQEEIAIMQKQIEQAKAEQAQKEQEAAIMKRVEEERLLRQRAEDEHKKQLQEELFRLRKQVEEEDTRKARIAEEERARQEAENRRQEESRTRAKAIRDLAQARRDAEEKARAEIAQNSLPVPFVVVSSIISWLTRR